MKKLIFISLLFLGVSALAEGPRYNHKETITQLEFENTYKDLRKKVNQSVLTDNTSGQLLVGQGVGVNPIWATNYLANYQRPRTIWASITSVDIATNTNVANTTRLIFRDGDMRTVTENVASASQYRRFLITENAEWRAGNTENSGLDLTLSEATNTRYSIFAIKSLQDASKFVLVGSTVACIPNNYALFDSKWGTDSWVYLATIFNGDEADNTGNIIEYEQHGHLTVFTSTTTGAALNGLGIRMANTASASSLSYTYASGMGAGQIPANIRIVNWHVTGGNGGALSTVEDQVVTNVSINRISNTPGLWSSWVPCLPAKIGIQHRTSSAAGKSIFLTGFFDSELGPGIP